MKLQDELKALKERIAELEGQVKGEQKFPQNGDDYWYVDDDAEVMGTVWYGDDSDQCRVSIDNVFKTEEEAEFVVEKLKVEADLRKFSNSWNLEKIQCSFSFNWESGKLEVEYPDYNQFPNSYYFGSINALQKAVSTVGEERIKKYIFGVED